MERDNQRGRAGLSRIIKGEEPAFPGSSGRMTIDQAFVYVLLFLLL